SQIQPSILRVDAGTGNVTDRYTLEHNNSGVRQFAFNPVESQLLQIRSDAELSVILLTGSWRGAGPEKFIVGGTTVLGQCGNRVAFAPDGKHFAVAWSGPTQADRKVTIYAAEGKVLHTLRVPAEHGLVFTPDGKTLITVVQGEGTPALTRWNVADGKKLSSSS